VTINQDKLVIASSKHDARSRLSPSREIVQRNGYSAEFPLIEPCGPQELSHVQEGAKKYS